VDGRTPLVVQNLAEHPVSSTACRFDSTTSGSIRGGTGLQPEGHALGTLCLRRRGRTKRFESPRPGAAASPGRCVGGQLEWHDTSRTPAKPASSYRFLSHYDPDWSCWREAFVESAGRAESTFAPGAREGDPGGDAAARVSPAETTRALQAAFDRALLDDSSGKRLRCRRNRPLRGAGGGGIHAAAPGRSSAAGVILGGVAWAESFRASADRGGEANLARDGRASFKALRRRPEPNGLPTPLYTSVIRSSPRRGVLADGRAQSAAIWRVVHGLGWPPLHPGQT